MAADFIVLLALILVNGALAGAEIAIVTLRRTRVDALVEERRAAARAVRALRSNPERLLATVQVGITMASAGAGAYGGDTLSGYVEPWIARSAWLADYAHELALLIVVVVVSYLSLVLGELVPKSLALRSPEPYALVAAAPVLALARVARPLVWLLTASSNLVLKLFGDRTSFSESRLSQDELKLMVDEARAQGALDKTVGDIAARTFDFITLVAEDVMVPRSKLAAIPHDASLDELRALVAATGHGRIPVYEGTIDEVKGFLSVRDLFSRPLDPATPLTARLRPVAFIPETMRATDVLDELHESGHAMAIVVDEHGGTAGLITREDLVEELVGEVLVETKPEGAVLRREPSGAVIVRGDATVRDVNRALRIAVPDDGDWTTIGGYLVSRLGRLPRRGERVTIDDGTVLEVAEASPRRVRALRITTSPVVEQA